MFGERYNVIGEVTEVEQYYNRPYLRAWKTVLHDVNASTTYGPSGLPEEFLQELVRLKVLRRLDPEGDARRMGDFYHRSELRNYMCPLYPIDERGDCLKCEYPWDYLLREWASANHCLVEWSTVDQQTYLRDGFQRTTYRVRLTVGPHSWISETLIEHTKTSIPYARDLFDHELVEIAYFELAMDPKWKAFKF